MATRNLTPEATEMLIGLLKGDTPIRRFQSGGMSENPEADYYEGGDDDAPGPPKTQPDRTRKRNRYLGVYQKLAATMNMLNKIGGAVGLAQNVVNIWNTPPPPQGGFAGPLSFLTAPTAVTIYAGGMRDVRQAGTLLGSIGNRLGWSQAQQASAAASIGGSLASFGLTQLISNIARKLTPDQTPFSFAKLDFFKGRGGDNEATYNKLMEAGFSGDDSLMDILGDTGKTTQDSYEFRD